MIRAPKMAGVIAAGAFVLGLTLLPEISFAQAMGGQAGGMGPGAMGQDHMKAMQEMHQGMMGRMGQTQGPAQAGPAAAATTAKANVTQTDRRGPVTVIATFTPAGSAGEPIRFTLKLDTHSVDLDGYQFDAIAFLRDGSGREVKATGVERTSGSGHHREATLVFSPQEGPIELLVKGVGGVAERAFRFDAGAAK